VPGQTVADRVAANRAEMIDLGCTSDPAAERPTTLGREPAIEWTFACNDSFSIARNAIHEGAGYRLSITTPSDREAEAPVLMARLAGSFVFVDAVTSPSPSTDLAAIDARLQGTWRTEWAPTALWIASVEAAGLDPDDLEGFRAEMLGSAKRRQTIRFQGDQMVEFVAIDNGQDQLGSQATYRLVDSDTIEAVSPDGVYRTTFDFQLQDDILVIDAIEDTDPLALIPQTAIFETLPFVRVP
jgi:hypothetical protein